MDDAVADNRKITHAELRHFTHPLNIRYLKTNLTVNAGV